VNDPHQPRAGPRGHGHIASMRGPRRFRIGLLAGIGIGLLVMTVQSSPSHACSCLSKPTAYHFENADIVFMGTVKSKTRTFSRNSIFRIWAKIKYNIDVETVFKGQDLPSIVVETPADGASCGVERLIVGQKIILSAFGSDGDYRIDLCGSIIGSPRGLRQEMENLSAR